MRGMLNKQRILIMTKWLKWPVLLNLWILWKCSCQCW